MLTLAVLSFAEQMEELHEEQSGEAGTGPKPPGGSEQTDVE